MPKFPTFPTLYDDVLQLNITILKQWGYLKPNQIKSGQLDWSRNGNVFASISIKVNTQTQNPFVELDYNFNDVPRNYKIQLVSMPSNLGKGLIWYFLCPQTKKRCRKLYQIGGYFLHREAFNGCFYESQIHSKYYREMEKTYGVYFKSEKLYNEIYSKHFTKYYNGKPTKRYLKLMKQIKQAESISFSEIKRLMYS
ncbi:hypothetical protein [Psychroflexus sp. MBR-150]|jgi:hypothetical protein